nr:MAG TPA: hypothetical protein [Caudoviricetes sp.]
MTSSRDTRTRRRISGRCTRSTSTAITECLS